MKNISILYLRLMLSIGVCPPLAAAFTEEDFLADIPIALTATRLAQPLQETPAAITIIDQEMIRASGSREIADLFRLVPGFIVSRDNGHSPIVTYHGLNGEYVKRLQVLVDGRSIYSPILGGVDWTNLPITIDDIERIEVIRGPNSASYGSNAFLSVINIITQHASETTGSFIRVARGNNDINDEYVRFGNTTGDFDYRITFAGNSDHGFRDRDDTRHIHTATLRGDYQVNAADNIMLQLGGSRGTRQVDSIRLGTFENREIRTSYKQIRWSRQISGNDELNLQFFHSLEKSDELFDVTLPIGRVVRNTSIRSERLDFELQHTKSFDTRKRLVWGFSIREDTSEGPQLFGTDPATGYTGGRSRFHNRLYRIFGNLEWRAGEKITLNLGSSWEKSQRAHDHNEISPRLGLNIALTQQQSIRISVSQAIRSPTLDETQSNFRVPVYGVPNQPNSFITTLWRGNKNLKPERITAYELGYHANLTKKSLTLDLKYYHEKLRDLISLDENLVSDPSDLLDGEYAIYGNLTDADVNGMEVSLQFQPLRDTRIILSHSRSRIASNNPNIISEMLAKSGPKYITSLLAINRFSGGVTGSLHLYRVSESNGLGSGEPLPGYNRFNIRLGVPFRNVWTRGEIAWIFQNVGSEYYDWRNDNLAERQHFISLSAEWN
jgi:iron complex outermembrane receptor protein